MLVAFKFSYAIPDSLKLRNEMLNAANIYLFGIKRTKCKCIDTSFVTHLFITCFIGDQVLNHVFLEVKCTQLYEEEENLLILNLFLIISY